VTSNLAPIADKLGKMIPMLASDRDGDVIDAAPAITRTLRNNRARYPRARRGHRESERAAR
jgi:hypothetical protein